MLRAGDRVLLSCGCEEVDPLPGRVVRMSEVACDCGLPAFFVETEIGRQQLSCCLSVLVPDD